METDAHRSWVMSRIHGKNTRPEMRVRSMLHCSGYRFRLHVRDMPGKPDIVLPRHRIAVFVNGCFWHQHPDCHRATIPKTNVDFWAKKFKQNTARDQAAYAALHNNGWRVLVIWECQTRPREKLVCNLASALPAVRDCAAHGFSK